MECDGVCVECDDVCLCGVWLCSKGSQLITEVKHLHLLWMVTDVKTNINDGFLQLWLPLLVADADRHRYLPDAVDLSCWPPPPRLVLLAATADCRDAFWELTKKLNLAAICTPLNNNWMGIPTRKFKQVSSWWLAPKSLYKKICVFSKDPNVK